MPEALSFSFTSSNLKGLMIASIFFMTRSPRESRLHTDLPCHRMVAQTACVSTILHPPQANDNRNGTLDRGIEGGDRRDSYIVPNVALLALFHDLPCGRGMELKVWVAQHTHLWAVESFDLGLPADADRCNQVA